jgi:hypothetical protein
MANDCATPSFGLRPFGGLFFFAAVRDSGKIAGPKRKAPPVTRRWTGPRDRLIYGIIKYAPSWVAGPTGCRPRVCVRVLLRSQPMLVWYAVYKNKPQEETHTEEGTPPYSRP